MGKTKTCSCYAAVVIALVVILRLGVGCHFLYEGLWKMDPDNGFSSKGFLGQAKGPTKDFYYMFLPDLGGEGRLHMEEAYQVKFQNNEVVPGSRKRLGWTLPVFEKEWFHYFDAYRAKYNLDAEGAKDQKTGKKSAVSSRAKRASKRVSKRRKTTRNISAFATGTRK